ncbi:aspartate aminotransferase family protein [Schlesneria sp. DSM 10557]|uniref:aspartate aminotransferase family protein n=1 Tax=Schlesneria sp. DSM 10557 TaxID=3044399 RepID=UPI0035A03FFA
MTVSIEFPNENRSNVARKIVAQHEPVALRTFTPSQAVFAKSAGVYHWTPEGRKLYDYSSGVLVANLGHNPKRWLQALGRYMGWSPEFFGGSPAGANEYVPAVTLTAYNGITEIETQAVERLLANLRRSKGSERLDTIVWAASGSEAVQKAIWASLSRDRTRDIILATRYGFHGKKGLANAVTGSEKDAERDPRVRFISFPMEEIIDAGFDPAAIDLSKYQQELEDLWRQFGRKISCLITEPYLGGGGSFHPPAAYHQMLQKFCREHDIVLIFDEVQANFGRTGAMYAFEAYGIEPDMVVLGKGLGNGIPVAAVASRGDVFATMKYGEASDTWSANPLSCAAVLATLDEFESTDVLNHARKLTPLFIKGLERLKSTGLVNHVRGEGLVFGFECASVGQLTAGEVAAKIVQACYVGKDNTGIHLLGALAGKVLRVSPPLTITVEEANQSLDLLYDLIASLAKIIR